MGRRSIWGRDGPGSPHALTTYRRAYAHVGPRPSRTCVDRCFYLSHHVLPVLLVGCAEPPHSVPAAYLPAEDGYSRTQGSQRFHAAAQRIMGHNIMCIMLSEPGMDRHEGERRRVIQSLDLLGLGRGPLEIIHSSLLPQLADMSLNAYSLWQPHNPPASEIVKCRTMSGCCVATSLVACPGTSLPGN